MANNTNGRPVAEIRVGRIIAAIWQNTPTDEGVFYSVHITRLFHRGLNWDRTPAFGRDDLLTVAKVAIGNVAELVLGCGQDTGDYISLAGDGSPEGIDGCDWPSTMGGAHYHAGMRGEFTYYGTWDFPYLYSSDRGDRAGTGYVGIRLVRELQE